jgi:hypothetical protein
MIKSWAVPSPPGMQHRQKYSTSVLICILMYPPHPLRVCRMSAGDLDSEGRRGSGLSQGSNGSEPPASPEGGAASMAGPGGGPEREVRRSTTLRRMGSMQGCVPVCLFVSFMHI